MEAMNQESMHHSRPHVEIWSAREGSDKDNQSSSQFNNLAKPNSSQPWTKGAHLRNQSLMDPKQTYKPQTMGSQMTHIKKKILMGQTQS